MAAKLIASAAAAGAILICVSAHAQEQPPSECKPPVSDVTANVMIGTLQCRLAILDRDRMREADRATMATAEAAMLSAKLKQTESDLSLAREALRAERAKKWWEK